MTTRSEREQRFAELWRQHLRAPFPDGLAGAEIAGVSLVLLDADLAGCISVWHSAGGLLDRGRRRTLERRLEELGRVLDLLEGTDEAAYFLRLESLARLANGEPLAGR